MKMTPLIRKLEALIEPDEHGTMLCHDSKELLKMAIGMEKGEYRCTQCGYNSLKGADDEGDMGWWCFGCMEKWEAATGCRWEDGQPIKP